MKEMGITISEKYLSPQVKKALANAKNKSQFIREALDFYVSRESIEVGSDTESIVVKEMDSEMKSDIKEIKKLLLNMSTIPAYTESAISKDVISTSNEQSQPVKVIDTVTDEVPVKPIEPLNTAMVQDDDNSDMSEEEKQRIQEMLENSINMF